jgi:hypothetical protein
MNDCYDYVVERAKAFGNIYPPISEIHSATYAKLKSIVVQEKQVGGWKKTEPFNGAIVLMGLSKSHMFHVGIFANGTVSHKLEGVIRNQPLSQLKMLYKEVEFYKWER